MRGPGGHPGDGVGDVVGRERVDAGVDGVRPGPVAGEAHGRELLRPHHARRDLADPHPGLGELEAQGLAQRGDGVLGRDVARAALVDPAPGRRPGEHHVPPRAGERRHERLHRAHRAEDVHVVGARPGVEVGLGDRRHVEGAAGVRDQQVDLRRGVDERVDRARVGDVEGAGPHARVLGRQLPEPVEPAGGGHDLPALLGQAPGRRGADPAAGAGDDGGPGARGLVHGREVCPARGGWAPSGQTAPTREVPSVTPRSAHLGSVRSVRPGRVAVLSVHTSPLEQPGTGDAGGLNVYVVETSARLAERGVEVEVFTRATRSDLPPVVELAPGVTVRHVTAGPFEGLSKDDLPAQLCALTSGVLRAEAAHDPGWYDVVHSHYWLSGQVGWLASERWGVPLVHTAHTLAKVKNRALAEGDTPEPLRRVVGEQQVVEASDRLVANTADEARQLLELYDADPRRVVTVEPGRRPRALPARARRAARAPASACRPTPSCCCSSGASSRSRRPTSCCTPPRGCCSGPRPGLCATASSWQSWADRAAPGCSSPPPCRTSRTRSASPTSSASRRPRGRARAAATGCATGTPPPTSSPSPATTSRSGSWRSRPRPAAPRSSPPTSAACAPPSATASRACWCPGTAPTRWADALSRAVAERRRLSPGAVAHAAAFSWDRTADGLLRTYRDAVADRARPAAGGRAVSGLHDVIAAALDDAELTYDRPGEGQFFVTLPGTHKLATHCWLVVGRHALLVEAFVCRKPDENVEEFYRFLLRRNARTYAVSFALDEAGDVYLVGRLPLAAVTAGGGRPPAGFGAAVRRRVLRPAARDRLRRLDPPRVGLAPEARHADDEPAGVRPLRRPRPLGRAAPDGPAVGCGHGDPRAAPSRRERVEQEEPVHRLGRRRPHRARRGAGPPRRSRAEQGRAAADGRAHLAA